MSERLQIPDWSSSLDRISKDLKERGGRSLADYFRDKVDALSSPQREEVKKRLIEIYKKYQGPGGP